MKRIDAVQAINNGTSVGLLKSFGCDPDVYILVLGRYTTLMTTETPDIVDGDNGWTPIAIPVERQHLTVNEPFGGFVCHSTMIVDVSVRSGGRARQEVLGEQIVWTIDID